MAYARPFNQAQGASPWSAGVPPGLQQPQQAQAHQQAQQMFNQPMGAFDLSGAWQGQQQAGQWATPMQPMQQPIQFVPNPAFMQQPPPQQLQHQQQQQRFQQQQQRPMHQRSLSAPRIGVNGQNRRGNQNNSFGGGSGGGGGGGGGGQWQPRQQQQHQQNNNNNNQQQQQQQRNTRQQSRQQKVQFSNNNNNNNNNNYNTKQQNQQRQQQQQPQQQKQKQQQQQQQAPKKGPVKVTKVVKKQALKAKQGVAKVKSADSSATNDKATTNAATNDQQTPSTVTTANKPQSKTAERKQLKLQARKNAEGLKASQVAVIKTKKVTSESRDDGDKPIDQAQLRCVPAVFGFVCKACDVFLRDRFARRNHIESDDHLEKYKAYEEELKKLKDASEQKAEPSPAIVASGDATDEHKPSTEEEQTPEVASGEETTKEVENEESSA